jgi:HlyD family secretion protein
LLGCPPGTISSRLTRARERLRDRLTRRGFAPAALVLTALAGDASAVTVPNALVESIMRTATPFATASPHGGSPTRSATIAEGVVRTMLVNKLKIIPALLMIGLVAAGAVLAASDPNRDETPNLPQPVAKLAADEKAPPAVPVVRLVKPQQGGLDRVTYQRCVAQAGQEVRLFPATSGLLKRVDVHIGDRVKAGQILAEIDAPALDLDKRLAVVGVEQAEALLKEAEARVATAKVEIEAAKGVIRLRQAEVNAAKSNVEVRKKAFEIQKTGGVTTAELNEFEGKFRAAEGQLDAATVGAENAKTDLAGKESKLVQAEAGVIAARANVKAAMVALDRSRLAIAQTQIAAPFDGVLAESNAAPGQLVRVPGERADPMSLFTVMRVDVLRLVLWLLKPDTARVEPGLAAEVIFDAIPNVKVAGKVARVGFVVESNGTVRVEIDLPNPKDEVRPGMTGTVALSLGKGPADALRVPLSSLVGVDRSKPDDPDVAVYVYKDGKAKLTPVRLGHQDGGKEAEVLSGLGREDLVVADPKALVGKVEVAVEVEKPAPPK